VVEHQVVQLLERAPLLRQTHRPLLRRHPRRGPSTSEHIIIIATAIRILVRLLSLLTSGRSIHVTYAYVHINITAVFPLLTSFAAAEGAHHAVKVCVLALLSSFGGSEQSTVGAGLLDVRKVVG